MSSPDQDFKRQIETFRGERTLLSDHNDLTRLIERLGIMQADLLGRALTVGRERGDSRALRRQAETLERALFYLEWLHQRWDRVWGLRHIHQPVEIRTNRFAGRT